MINLSEKVNLAIICAQTLWIFIWPKREKLIKLGQFNMLKNAKETNYYNIKKINGVYLYQRKLNLLLKGNSGTKTISD